MWMVKLPARNYMIFPYSDEVGADYLNCRIRFDDQKPKHELTKGPSQVLQRNFSWICDEAKNRVKISLWFDGRLQESRSMTKTIYMTTRRL